MVACDELVVVARPEHRWARRAEPILPAELASTPLVSRETGSGTREFFESALADFGASPCPPVLELSTSAAVRAAVLAGSAPAVLSRLAVADDVSAGRLRIVPVDGLDLRRDLRAVWQGGRTPPAGAVRDLLAHIGSAHRRSR